MIIAINADLFKKPVTWIVIAVLSVALGGGGYYIYRFKPNLLSPLKDVKIQQQASGQLTPDQTQKLLAEVGKIIDLPTGEIPTVATITDITKLQDQDFFKKAHNGDQVIIYTQAKKAYLYNPTLKKIIDVQPISVPDASASATQVDSVPTIAITPTLFPTPKQATSSAIITP